MSSPNPSSRRPVPPLRALAATAGLAAVLCVALLAPPPARAADAPAAPELVRGLPDFTGLVEVDGPAVVNIRTTEHMKAPTGGKMDPGVEEFLRRFGIPVPKDPRGQPAPGDDDEAQRRGVGSGFIISADGYLLTNAHVVDGADELLVTLTDKREFKGKLIGTDARTDVAVVKIEAAGLPFLKIGNPDRLKVGEWVIAIGSPFNLENSVTAGIVSAKKRETGDYLPLIQTDVAINPGNSGGPLINMRGEVVGINSQILSPSGGYAGISLAIPIDEVMRVADQLRTLGKVIRGRIGVSIAVVPKDIAESIGLGKPIGALVQQVQPGLPADKAGIEPGDVITQVDGAPVERSSDLPRLIGVIAPGTKASLKVFHDGKFKDVPVTVVEFETDKTAAADVVDTETASRSLLGLKVSDLTDAQKAELRVKGGVKVDAADGPAARAGLREGDVLLKANNVEITGAKQFTALLARLDKSKPINVLARRGDQATFVLIKPAAAPTPPAPSK